MKRVLPLSDTKLRTLKPGPKNQNFFDGGGLYLLVKPNGSKVWRLKYRFAATIARCDSSVMPRTVFKHDQLTAFPAGAMLVHRSGNKPHKKHSHRDNRNQEP